MAHTVYPATQKQTDYIKALLDKRVVEPRWLAQAQVDLDAGLDTQRASKWIGWLVDQPMKPKVIQINNEPAAETRLIFTHPPMQQVPKTITQATWPSPLPPAVPTPVSHNLFPGIYDLAGKLYRITRKGTQLRVKEVVTGNGKPWYSRPGYGVITRLMADEGRRISATEAASHGLKSGWCICCGRQLTDPESVAAGIGPVCASQQSRTIPA
jgi:hypothetical protein